MNKKDVKIRKFGLFVLCSMLVLLSLTIGYFIGRHSARGDVTLHPGVYVTTENQEEDTSDTTMPSDTASLINLNTATAAELDTLPGIGPVISERIIEYRETNGSFDTPAQIMNVSGIGTETYLNIKDLITTD